MADFSYDTFVEEADLLPGPRHVRRLTNGAGAALSVALILGLAVWGYQIAVRDARGVPVVQALQGPMRIAPEKPGGEQMAHQGLAVNTVAAAGEVAAPADRVMLAPRPVELTDQDQAGFAPIPPSAVVPTLTATIPIPGQFADEGSSTAALEGDAAAIAGEPETTAAAAVRPEAAVLAEAEVLATALVVPVEVQTPALPLPAAIDVALAEAVAAEPVIVGASAAAVAVSLLPVARPSKRQVFAPQAPHQVVAATSVAPGTRLIQLGAYDDAAAAQADWERLTSRYAAYFKGKSPVIQQAASGGRTFYRLRAVGFDGEDDARRLCAVLLNDQMQCIPVLTR